VEAWFDAVKLTQDTTVLEVTRITPAMGKTVGGDDVVVLGKVFPEGSTVALGGKALVDGVRATSCSFAGKTPAHDAGLVDVAVTVGEGSATLPGAFRYVAPPTVLSIEPSTGPVEGGTDVTITGESFVTSGVSRISVTFGSRGLVATDVPDEATITGKTPIGDPGPVDVTVRTPFGEVVVAGGFTYAQVGTRFIRGNCDGDPSLNITDAISVLGFLFLGSAEPACLEGCNTNDDGEVNITDGISILNFLFTGGPAPAAPYPDCGTDPTEGKGCLASHSGC
jgi:hypothetical protein